MSGVRFARNVLSSSSLRALAFSSQHGLAGASPAGTLLHSAFQEHAQCRPFPSPAPSAEVPQLSRTSATSTGLASAAMSAPQEHSHCRAFSSSAPSADVPALADVGAAAALRHMLASPWHHMKGQVLSEAERAMHKASDEASKLALMKATAAAEAVEVFGQKLELLRSELDELSGGKFGGEEVGDLPQHVKAALLSAMHRYSRYLGSFAADEEWLRKKVQEELGSQLLLVKQRCSGLESEWNKISLIGTSGLSGSYIEKRK